MPILELTVLVCLGSLLTGLLGSLTGLGGGAIIVPMLVLGFGVDIRYAMGASLVSVIATSSGAAATYVREGFSNIRIGMFLEIATAGGAIVGASLVHQLPTNYIAMVFGAVLILSAFLSLNPPHESALAEQPDRMAVILNLDSSYPTVSGPKAYCVRNVPAGFASMFGAGILSGLLGIGSGAFKVLAMDHVMRLPFKVSATTSNFMIGVTAAAGAGIYLRDGFVAPGLAMPVIVGTLLGSVAGTHVLLKSDVKWLRVIFSIVIMVLGVEMIYGGITGRL
jgi:uncharacterized membrane protein YfcA